MYNFGFSGLAAFPMHAETLQVLRTHGSPKDTKEKLLTNIVYFVVERREVLAAFVCGM
jgi:hypothetical protein